MNTVFTYRNLDYSDSIIKYCDFIFLLRILYQILLPSCLPRENANDITILPMHAQFVIKTSKKRYDHNDQFYCHNIDRKLGK